MINAMRTLALDYIFEKIGNQNEQPENLEEWYYDLRKTHLESLFPFLVESADRIEKVYILEKDENINTFRLVSEEITEEKEKWLPFMRPSGPQSPQVGPVIKRSYNKEKGGGPSTKILVTTMQYFSETANTDKKWAPYFKEITELLNYQKFRLLDNTIINWKDEGYKNLFAAAIALIGEQKGTVFLSVRDNDGNLPGQRQDYLNYLMIDKLAGTRYITGNTPAIDNQTCPLCGISGVTVFPNALKGAGINISNADRVGAFPNIDSANAWKGFALCNACADLLYIYKYHFLKKDSNGRNSFITPIAGTNAIVVPFVTADYNARHAIWKNVNDIVISTSTDVEEDEITLLETLKDEKEILNLTFLWATVGQNIEDVTGMITNVPPTRLVELSKINEESRKWKHPLFPHTFIRTKKNNLQPDLSLGALKTLFNRLGGKKAKNANSSMKLQRLKKEIAASVYHKTEISTVRFWEEIVTTARWYWLDAVENGNAYGLLNEGRKKTGETFLTAAGWIKHLCWWIYYLKKLEVMKMEDKFYEPKMENLKHYFGPESGIDSSPKAFAFLLGVLYGKVLQVQGARGINVGANALTWLKRLTLKGRDLPELYVKIREKLLSYETEKNADVRELIKEIGRLGVQLGDKIELDETATNYYLLLGQSLTTSILSKKGKDENQTGGNDNE